MSKISYRTFDGNCGELAAFIEQNWQEAYAQRGAQAMWNRGIFEWFFTKRIPKKDWDLSWLAYDGAKLAGCALCFPETYSYCSRRLLAGKLGWVTVDARFSDFGHRLSFGLLNRVANKIIEKDFDLLLGFSHNKFTANFWRNYSRYSVKRFSRPLLAGEIGEFGYLVKILDPELFGRWSGLQAASEEKPAHYFEPAAEPGLQVRELFPSDIAGCLKLLTCYEQKFNLARVWSIEELTALFNAPGITGTYIIEKNRVLTGFLSFSFFSLQANRQLLSAAYLNNCFLDNLSDKESRFLFDFAFSKTHQRRCAMLCVPAPGYFNREIFLEYGFFEIDDVFKVFYGTACLDLNLESQPRAYLEVA